MSKPVLPFLGGGRAEGDVSPPWRADFRDTSRLPDLKVVRTDFLINYGLFGLAVVAFSYAAFVEFGHWGLSKEIDELNRDIESRKAQNAKSLASSGDFSAYMSFADEFAKFKKPKMDCVDMLVALGAFKPEGLTITGITVDASYVDPKTKKEKVRVQMTGTKKGFTPENVNLVGAAYKRFIELDLWKRNKDFFMPTPPSPGIQNSEKSIDFTFELFLEAK